jgi:hypothetical protein
MALQKIVSTRPTKREQARKRDKLVEEEGKRGSAAGVGFIKVMLMRVSQVWDTN